MRNLFFLKREVRSLEVVVFQVYTLSNVLELPHLPFKFSSLANRHSLLTTSSTNTPLFRCRGCSQLPYLTVLPNMTVRKKQQAQNKEDRNDEINNKCILDLLCGDTVTEPSQ